MNEGEPRRRASGPAPNQSDAASGAASGAARAPSRQSGRAARTWRSGRDLTRGNVRRHVWYLGWPQVAEGFLGVADQIADLVWAGRLGFHAIAGLGAAQAYLSTVMMARMGLDSGMRSMIARAVGARRFSRANHALLQSFTLTTILAVLMIAVGSLLTEPLLRVIGLSEDAVAEGADYMRVQFWAMAALSYHRLFGGALQAAGDSITPLYAALASRALHIALSPLLIFGWLGMPELGLAGASYARLAAEFIGVGITLWTLSRGGGRARMRMRFSEYSLDMPLIWTLVRQGAPASVTNMQRGVSQLVVVGVAAQFGDVALAAFALARRAENVVNQSARGMGRAAGAMAGQNLGAGDAARARSAVRWAMAYGLALTMPFIAALIAFPETAAGFFNSDPAFISDAAMWLTIAAVGYIFMSPVQIFTQAFNTSGSAFAPMVITVATMWAVEIPLTFALAHLTPLGQFGVPAAIVAGMALRLAAFAWYYRSSRWLRTGAV